MTMDECDKAVAVASSGLERSQVMVTTAGRGRGGSSTQEVRSSRTGDVELTVANGLDGVELRMENITGVSNNHNSIG
eukprot:gene14765-3082_t